MPALERPRRRTDQPASTQYRRPAPARISGNPSPTAGSSTSAKANAAADAAAFQASTLQNAKKKGHPLVVILVKSESNNAGFTQRFLPNNIADFAELELSQANFPVLERSNLGHCSA